MESLTSAIIIIIAFVTLLIYSFIRKSRKASKKREPPQAAGAWPVIGHLHLLSGSQPPHITLGNLADKYGPIFTIKLGVHRTLIVSNGEIAKECLTTNDKAFASRPKSLAMEILGYDYSMLGFSPYGEYWRQMRKIITLELLSKHRLEMLKRVREVEVKTAIKGLYQEWMKSRNSSNKILVEMKKWFSDITLNVILKVIVGQRLVELLDGEQDEGSSNSWQDALREFMELSGKFSVSDALPYLRWLDLGGVEKEMKQNLEKLDCVVRKWLQDRRDKKSSGIAKRQEGFMDVLLSILNDAEELSGRDADTINKATCLALILAASDTTAITLTWTLSLLLNNREALKAAQHEVDIHVGKERQVTESDARDLVYLQAIIKESFRLYPAVPLLLPHEAMEECTVNGYHIPAGTRLIINVSKVHEDPSVWLNPQEFQPERFLTSHKDVDFRGQNFDLIPFGSGRRKCPGILFALQVLSLTLATVLHSFEIETSSDNPIDMCESAGTTNAKASPLEVVLTPRLPAHLY
ncbi:cytochrome P450, putative [Ricinus communis]|uniref:Cytochrome P450, putative n=1 Tax=Ricinus communis TaxID=3988 RepID=B9R7L8_RICCO|nr:cytochrome P450, putative [Ricinus communis]|eukprot:XP_002510311.1 cytochrome P450 CYP82D47 [Ricinus communis]